VNSATSSSQTALCAECGAVFNLDSLISHEGKYICGRCKPIYLQRLTEGANRPVLFLEMRKKIAAIAGIALLCSIAAYALCALCVGRQPDPEPPRWLALASVVSMLGGIVSVAILLTSLLFRWYRKQ
jgi:ribosomal protein S27AE